MCQPKLTIRYGFCLFMLNNRVFSMIFRYYTATQLQPAECYQCDAHPHHRCNQGRRKVRGTCNKRAQMMSDIVWAQVRFFKIHSTVLLTKSLSLYFRNPRYQWCLSPHYQTQTAPKDLRHVCFIFTRPSTSRTNVHLLRATRQNMSSFCC